MNKLYLVIQGDNHEYDTYGDFVVCAKDIESAAEYDPHGNIVDWDNVDRWTSWAHKRENVKAQYVGIAAEHFDEGDIISSSYRAG